MMVCLLTRIYVTWPQLVNTNSLTKAKNRNHTHFLNSTVARLNPGWGRAMNNDFPRVYVDVIIYSCFEANATLTDVCWSIGARMFSPSRNRLKIVSIWIIEFLQRHMQCIHWWCHIIKRDTSIRSNIYSPCMYTMNLYIICVVGIIFSRLLQILSPW